MYILTPETLHQLESKVSDDLFLLLNRFKSLNSPSSPTIVGSHFKAGKSKKNTKKNINKKKNKRTKNKI